MTTIRVFDPAMCCSTGVCGPSVDPELVRFAADLDWLKTQGVSVERFNLAQQPGAFVDDTAVRAVLDTKGEAGLPLIEVSGQVKVSGAYPSRAELAAWTGIGETTASLYTDAVAELVAIGASIAASCVPCFKFHHDKARKLGVSADDMARAVATAQAVKTAQGNAVLDAAARHLHRDPATIAPQVQSGGCCGAAEADETTPATTARRAAGASGWCGPASAIEDGPTEHVAARTGDCCGASPGASNTNRSSCC
jgi:AhpD family alkylhydroperoxidase